MRRATTAGWRGAVIAAVLWAAGGCSSALGTSETLSFADMQALNAGVHAEWILEEYPFAQSVDRGPDGRIRSLRYGVEDSRGKRHTLDMDFDANGVLVRKRYSGPLVRPPRPPS